MSTERNYHTERIAGDIRDQISGTRAEQPSVYSCPACGGVLWQVANDEVVEFSCHTGHHYTPDALLADKSQALTQAISEAVRALKERAILLRQLAVTLNAQS